MVLEWGVVSTVNSMVLCGLCSQSLFRIGENSLIMSNYSWVAIAMKWKMGKTPVFRTYSGRSFYTMNNLTD